MIFHKQQQVFKERDDKNLCIVGLQPNYREGEAFLKKTSILTHLLVTRDTMAQ
jgi:hypothetical protein